MYIGSFQFLLGDAHVHALLIFLRKNLESSSLCAYEGVCVGGRAGWCGVVGSFSPCMRGHRGKKGEEEG